MARMRRWLAITEQPEFNVAVFAFLLNYPWEFSQVPLFAGMPNAPHWTAIKVCATATLGDIVIMLVAYSFVALVAHSRRWIAAPTASHLTMFVFIGLAITVVIEQLALHGLWFGTWSYSPLMPVVPRLGVGLSPVLQWIILPLLLVWLVRRQLAGGHYLSARCRNSSMVRTKMNPKTQRAQVRTTT